MCAIHGEDIIVNSTTEMTGVNINVPENVNTKNVSTEAAIQRKVEVLDGPLDTNNASLKEFRPSPQLETIYEFNKTPVVPVVGEAKEISNLNQPHQANARTFFWPLSNEAGKQPATTTEAAWVRRVVFPQTTAETTRDQPYPFVTSSNNVPIIPHAGTFGPSRIPPSSYGSTSPDNPRGYSYNPSKWDQYGSSGIGVNKNPAIMHKTHYESYGPPEATPTGVSKISPIKKIIGLLAAFIPLGLLISALTPSVIQVVPMNTT